MTKHRWDNQPRYRMWVKARDKALEQLHTRAQIETTDVLRHLFAQTLLLAKSHFHMLKINPGSIDQLDHQLRGLFAREGNTLLGILKKLRAHAYLLAKSSEAEIIAQMQPGRHVMANVTRSHIHQVENKNSMAGGPLHHRIQLYLDRLRRKVISMAQTSALNTEKVEDFLFDVRQVLPKARIVKRPRRILKPQLMEAEGDPPKVDFAIDNIDDETWQQMLADYMNDYVPKSRAPEYVVDLPITDPTVQADGTEVWYAWEFERDMTNEFVKSVRDGQVDAANDNGITDFVWISVVDDKTDSCCLWRDGLLTSEIEAQMGDHTDEDDECDVGDGVNPPIHFNCRCTLAPATDNIPDKPDTMAKDFDDWLMGDV